MYESSANTYSNADSITDTDSITNANSITDSVANAVTDSNADTAAANGRYQGITASRLYIYRCHNDSRR